MTCIILDYFIALYRLKRSIFDGLVSSAVYARSFVLEATGSNATPISLFNLFSIFFLNFSCNYKCIICSLWLFFRSLSAHYLYRDVRYFDDLSFKGQRNNFFLLTLVSLAMELSDGIGQDLLFLFKTLLPMRYLKCVFC